MVGSDSPAQLELVQNGGAEAADTAWVKRVVDDVVQAHGAGVSISLEYAHTYVDEPLPLSSEVRDGVLAATQLAVAFDAAGCPSTRVVLLDDYNPTTVALDGESLLVALESLGLVPAMVAMESDALCLTRALLDGLGRSSRRSLERWVQARGKWPCSALVAVWYLYRLGLLVAEPDSKHPWEGAGGAVLLNVLPARFDESEANALSLIRDSVWSDAAARIFTVAPPDPLADSRVRSSPEW